MCLLIACSPSIKVFSDNDSEADISNYAYYNWLPNSEIEARGQNPLYYNELTNKRIKTAVDKQLQNRGYILRQTPQAIQMHFHILVEDKTMAVRDPLPDAYNAYWLKKEVNTYPYQQGTLIIDLMDSTTKTLVWRGWATAVIDPETKTKPEAAINRAVANIFKQFPYRRF